MNIHNEPWWQMHKPVRYTVTRIQSSANELHFSQRENKNSFKKYIIYGEKQRAVADKQKKSTHSLISQIH